MGVSSPKRRSDLTRRLDAVHSRHLPIDEDQVVGIATSMADLGHFDALGAIQRLIAADAQLPEHHLCMFACYGVVVDHEHRQVVRMQLADIFALHASGIE